VEDRLDLFKNAFTVLFPDRDIEVIAKSLLEGGEMVQDSEQILPSPPPPSVEKEPETSSVEPSSETVPQKADGFDWVEKEVSLGDLSDGMAALSVRPEGAGYLGRLAIFLQFNFPIIHQVF
jgi:transcriptional regulatory protein GAL4